MTIEVTHRTIETNGIRLHLAEVNVAMIDFLRGLPSEREV
jgi:hypothetical protein